MRSPRRPVQIARRRRRLPAGLAAVPPTALAAALLAGCGGSAQEAPGPGPSRLGSLQTSGAGHVFFEVYEPAVRPRGTMLVFHGGGWENRRGDARAGVFGPAAIYRAQGWRVINAEYSQPAKVADPSAAPDGRPTLRDVVAFYDQARRAFGGPICATGPSAGGHLAAMLAVMRPSLRCALAEGAPTDLVTLRSEGDVTAAALADRAFGGTRSALAAWSPARLWDPARMHTHMFVTAADNDPFVATAQARAFQKADRDAVVEVLPGAQPGDPDATGFVHSAVRRTARVRLIEREDRWLDRLVPPRTGGSAPTGRVPGAPAGAACDSAVPRADWAKQPRDDRWRLLAAGRPWTQVVTPGVLMAATAGCSGSARWQDDGISVWAFPTDDTQVPRGGEAAQVYEAPGAGTLTTVRASLRGFLARPSDWRVGLFASDATSGPVDDPVATCTKGRCTGLRLVGAHGGALVASPGSGDPDATDEPPVQTFRLPRGTRRVAWRLTCVAPKSCDLRGIGRDKRERDPLGHPAILSLYRLDVR
jgi:acetyl esterase/lipase